MNLHERTLQEQDSSVSGEASLGTKRLCPICDSAPESHRAVLEDHPWQVVRCTLCSMVFLANVPDYTSLAEEYAWEESYAAESTRRRAGEPRLKALQDRLRPIRKRLRGNKLHRLMNIHMRLGRVLDLGCGTGHRMRKYLAASATKIHPYGIELEPGPAATAHSVFRAHGGEVYAQPAIDGLRRMASGSMDGAVLYAYLEHETQPGPVLVELHRVLRPRCPVIIKVPNYASMNRRIRGRRWCGYRFPDHVNYFTPQTLRRLLTDCGFEVQRFGYWDRFPFNDNMWAVALTGHTSAQATNSVPE